MRGQDPIDSASSQNLSFLMGFSPKKFQIILSSCLFAIVILYVELVWTKNGKVVYNRNTLSRYIFISYYISKSLSKCLQIFFTPIPQSPSIKQCGFPNLSFFRILAALCCRHTNKIFPDSSWRVLEKTVASFEAKSSDLSEIIL